MGHHRVIRGGSFDANAQNCRSAQRNANHPGNRWHNLGFRLAREHAWTGRSAPDPIGVRTAGDCAGGEEGMGGRGASSGVRSMPRTLHGRPAAGGGA